MTELRRRLGLFGAVVLGLGGMLGTGVFVAVGPASRIAGGSVLLSLGVAALVAACNATSSARLAAADPVSGGAYQWGRRHLGRFWGLLAGWCFLVGKTASAAAASLAVGLYAWPEQAVPVACLVVVAATVLNVLGVQRTAGVSAVLVAFVVVVLLLVVVSAGREMPDRDVVQLVLREPVSVFDVLAAAGVLFLAVAGYARVATLGEEVRDPARVIPRAVAIALTVVTLLYALVTWRVSQLVPFGPDSSLTPVAELASTSGLPLVGPVAVAAVLAASAVLLGVLAGTSRTALAMARHGDLPRGLAAVHPRWGTPWVAQVLAGVVALVVVLAGGVVGAIVVSAITVLVYYSVANAAALRLEGGLPARCAAVVGLAGCPVVATALLLSTNPWS